MIDQSFNIQDWNIQLLIDIQGTYSPENILSILQNKGCTYKQAVKAYETIFDKSENIGFTYGNYFNKLALIFIGRHSTKDQFINTIVHESRHLQLYISNLNLIDQNSEYNCYLIGEIVLLIYKICNKYALI